MSGPADLLLELIYDWIKAASKCSSNLRDLAVELESLRENCNAVETVSSTVAVAATVLSIFAAPFTGGASLAVGAVAGGLGAGVSAITKIIEKFESSSKLERVKEIDRKCNEITSNINSYYNILRGKCPFIEYTIITNDETYSYNKPYSYQEREDEKDKYVMKELLKAMLRRSGLDVGLKEADLDKFVTDIIKDALNTFTQSPFSELLLDVIGVLSVFSLKLGGSLVCSLAAAGGVQIGKTVLTVGGKAAFLGLAALGFTLYESISNWKELVKNKHETEASKSVRDTADKIDETENSLSEKLSRTENIVKKEVNELRSKRRKIEPESSSSSSESSSDEAGQLRMALINSRSVNPLIRRNESTLSDLIEDNDLDVLLITETWRSRDNQWTDDFRTILPENNTVISNRRFFRRGGGVAIVTRLDATAVVFPYYPETFEYVAATVRRSEVDEPTLILNIYRPPENNHAEFFDELRTLLCMALPSFTRVVIAGDFNIHMDHPGSHVTRDFQTLLSDFRLRQHVFGSTHRAGHTLDLVITRRNVRVTNLSVQPNDPRLTDHSTVFFTVDVKRSDGTDDDVDDLIGDFRNMFS